MKYLKLILSSLLVTVLAGSAARHFQISDEFVQICFFLILMYVISLGIMGSILLSQIFLLAYKIQMNEKEIRTSLNKMRDLQQLNIKNFYKSFLRILKLNLIQKQIVKNLLKLGLSMKILSRR